MHRTFAIENINFTLSGTTTAAALSIASNAMVQSDRVDGKITMKVDILQYHPGFCQLVTKVISFENANINRRQSVIAITTRQQETLFDPTVVQERTCNVKTLPMMPSGCRVHTFIKERYFFIESKLGAVIAISVVKLELLSEITVEFSNHAIFFNNDIMISDYLMEVIQTLKFPLLIVSDLVPRPLMRIFTFRAKDKLVYVMRTV